MKKTVIIVFIVLLSIAAICLGVLIALTPDPVQPVPEDPHTPNSLITTLGIERPDTTLERLLVLKTYQGGLNADDLLEIAQVGGLEYYELDQRSNDYLLITPFEINGKLEISKLVYDTRNEIYVPESVAHTANGGNPLPDNYSLLIRYSRPEIPEYEIKLTQPGITEVPQTATYQIVNMEGDSLVGVTQFIKDDARDSDVAPTESSEVKIKPVDEDGEIIDETKD